PKSLDVGKAIDKRRDERHEEALKVTREIAGRAKELGISRRDINLKINDADNSGGSAQSWTTISSAGAHKPRVPEWDQWVRLRELLNLSDPVLDAEVWRLNGRKGTPGEAWEKREVVGAGKSGKTYGMGGLRDMETSTGSFDLTAPATSEAQRWDGWGTALKPAIEPIILARKPLDGTVANNVLAHGVGGLNIDACRVPSDVPIPSHHGTSGAAGVTMGKYRDYVPGSETAASVENVQTAGRFPANVLLDEHAAKEMDEQSGWSKSPVSVTRGGKRQEAYGMGRQENMPAPSDSGGASRFFPVFKSEEETPETKGRFPANVLLDEHAAAEMDEQSGWQKDGTAVMRNRKNSEANPSGIYSSHVREAESDQTFGSGGGASRFFPVFKYQAKA